MIYLNYINSMEKSRSSISAFIHKTTLLIVLVLLGGTTLLANDNAGSSEAWMPKRVNRIKQIRVDQHILEVVEIERNEAFLLSGSGQMYLDFADTQVAVAFRDAQVDREGNLLTGSIYLQEDAAVQTLRDEKDHLKLNEEAVGNAYLTLAQTTTSLPIGLNPLLSENQMNAFNKHQLLITDLSISREGMQIDYSMLSPSVNGGYYVFEKKQHLSDDPLALCDLSEMYLAVADPPLQNYEFPIEIKVTSTIDENKKSKANFNCGGLVDFYLVGEYTFPIEKAIPLDGTLTNVMAYFEVNALEVEQFIADVVVTPYRIPGAEAFYFTPSFARLDYSDSANPVDFPDDHPRQVDESWKGIYLHSKLAFPKGFKMSDGSDLEIEITNFVYDHGDGFCGREKQIDLLPLETSRIYGWPVSMDLLDLEVKYSSFVKFDIEGEVRMPITNTDHGFPYSLRLNGDGVDLNENSSIAGLFQLNDESAFDNSYEIPYLQGSSMALETSSNIKLLSIDDELQLQADLNGVMGAIVDGHSIPMTFEHMMINNRDLPGMEGLAAGTITGGLDRMSISTVKWSVANNALQSVLNNGPNAGTYSAWDWLKPKLSYFPIKVDFMTFKMEDIDGQTFLSMNASVSVDFTIMGKGLTGGCEFEVVGDVNLEALNTPSYWEVLQYNETMLGLMYVDIDLVIFQLKGGMRFFRDDAIYGDGWKGAMSVTITKGFPIQVVALAQYGRAPGDYPYMFFDAIVSMDTKEDFYKEDNKTGNYTKVSSTDIRLKKSLHYKAKKEYYWDKIAGVDAAREAHSISVDDGKGVLTATDVFGQTVTKSGSSYQQDLKNPMRLTIEPGMLAIYGGGIGLFANMDRVDPPNNFNANGRFVTDEPMNYNDPLDLLKPGKTLTGAVYVPRNNTIGIKLTVVLGSDPKPNIYNGDFHITFLVDIGDFSLLSIRLGGIAYLLTPLHDRSDAQAYLQANADLNWERRELNLEANAFVMLHIPNKISGGISAATLGFLKTPYISQPLIEGVNPGYLAGSAGIRVHLNEFNRWMAYVGTAQNPVGLKSRLLNDVSFGSYFMTGRVEMMGSQADPRPLSSYHSGLAEFDGNFAMDRTAGEIASGNVWLTGAYLSLPTFDKTIFDRLRVVFGAAAGYDIGIMSSICNNGTTIGIGGKYARGRIFGYLKMEGQIDPPGGGDNWKNVGSVEIAANLEGRTPNPTFIKGRAKATFSLSIPGPDLEFSFDKDVEAEFGSGCGNDISTACIEEDREIDIYNTPVPIHSDTDWSYALNTNISDISLSAFEPMVENKVAKELLLSEPLIMHTLPAQGQVYGAGDLYIEVAFTQTMQQQSKLFPDLQPILDYVSLHDETGKSIGYDLHYLRDQEERPGSEEGFDIVRIYPDQGVNVQALKLTINATWMQYMGGKWKPAKMITQSTYGQLYENEYEVEQVKFVLFQEDFAELVPVWRDRYYSRTQAPKLVLNNEMAIKTIGEEAIVRISALNSDQEWEYPVATINSSNMEINISGFQSQLEKGAFYRLEIINKDKRTVFENIFRTSAYESFAQKVQAASLDYQTVDLGNDIRGLAADGTPYNYTTSCEYNDSFNEVRFLLKVDEGFSKDEIELYLSEMKADASTAYFETISNLYQTDFTVFADAEQDLYSTVFAREMSKEELQKWFSFDESDQFQYILTRDLDHTLLTDQEIDKGKIIAAPVDLLIECEAIKQLQFRYELAYSLYNPHNRQALASAGSTETWKAIQQVFTSYNSCLYDNSCTINSAIPWYGDQVLKMKIDNVGLELNVTDSATINNF